MTAPGAGRRPACLPAAEPPAARLRWQARRGMLELEVWLNRYLDLDYARASVARKRGFVYLLAQDDLTLYDWLCRHVEPPGALRGLIDRMRELQRDPPT